MKKNAIKDLKQRLVTSAVCLIFLVIVITLAPHPFFKPIFTLLVSMVSSLALIEYFHIAKAKGIRPSTFIAVVATVLYTFSIFLANQYPQLTPLPFVVIGLFLLYLFIDHFSAASNALSSIATTFFGMIYVTVPLALFVPIIYFFKEDPSKGQLWILYLLATTKMTDVGALFSGRFLGKRKLLPKVSPNKTIAGAVGGTLCSIIVSLLFAYFSQIISIEQSIFLGFILSLFAQVGDLAESLLKRDGNIKDSGQNIPGLGGILDIVDSLIFTTPIVYLFLHITMG